MSSVSATYPVRYRHRSIYSLTTIPWARSWLVEHVTFELGSLPSSALIPCLTRRRAPSAAPFSRYLRRPSASRYRLLPVPVTGKVEMVGWVQTEATHSPSQQSASSVQASPSSAHLAAQRPSSQTSVSGQSVSSQQATQPMTPQSRRPPGQRQ